MSKIYEIGFEKKLGLLRVRLSRVKDGMIFTCDWETLSTTFLRRESAALKVVRQELQSTEICLTVNEFQSGTTR